MKRFALVLVGIMLAAAGLAMAPVTALASVAGELFASVSPSDSLTKDIGVVKVFSSVTNKGTEPLSDLTVQWLSGDELIDEYTVASIPPNSAEMFGFVEVAPTQADFELGRMFIVVNVSSSGWEAFQTFQVPLVRIGISSCSITWDTDEFSNDGSPHGPTVTVKDGDETLVEGVDYELGGDTSTAEAGDYELVITGKGWYEGKSSV
ncbi:MAG: hypothetical protein IKF96_04720, partial [Eggerthellaceae bacterium]|nr:hypothetical protein [Eggerthellaceae bacterium]